MQALVLAGERACPTLLTCVFRNFSHELIVTVGGEEARVGKYRGCVEAIERVMVIELKKSWKGCDWGFGGRQEVKK
jgi:hypothetical protein